MALTYRQQIARRHLVIRGIGTREAANFIGCDSYHLAAVLNGRSYPSPLVKERLPLLLDMIPIETLLDSELLNGTYRGNLGVVQGS